MKSILVECYKNDVLNYTQLVHEVGSKEEAFAAVWPQMDSTLSIVLGDSIRFEAKEIPTKAKEEEKMEQKYKLKVPPNIGIKDAQWKFLKEIDGKIVRLHSSDLRRYCRNNIVELLIPCFQS